MVTYRVASPPAWTLKLVRPSSSQRRIRDCSRNVHGQRGRRCGLARADTWLIARLVVPILAGCGKTTLAR